MQGRDSVMRNLKPYAAFFVSHLTQYIENITIRKHTIRNYSESDQASNAMRSGIKRSAIRHQTEHERASNANDLHHVYHHIFNNITRKEYPFHIFYVILHHQRNQQQDTARALPGCIFLFFRKQ